MKAWIRSVLRPLSHVSLTFVPSPLPPKIEHDHSSRRKEESVCRPSFTSPLHTSPLHIAVITATMTKTDASSSSTNRRTVVGLEAFARGGTGTGKAIAAFRDRKDRKRRHTAQALRQYAKVMQKEGYEPGKGASRKREDTIGKTEHDEKKDVAPPNDEDDKTGPRQRRHKTNPYKDLKPKEKSNIPDKEAQEKERKHKLRERRQRTRRLQQRTSKGQPIMKNLVHDILHKLEKEKQEEEQQR